MLSRLAKFVPKAVATVQPRLFSQNAIESIQNLTERPPMICFQCEQTKNTKYCDGPKQGVCGKSADVASLQDSIVHLLKGVGELVVQAKKDGVESEALKNLVTETLFATITNVNFSADRMQDYINEIAGQREELKVKYEQHTGKLLKVDDMFASFDPKTDKDELIDQSKSIGLFNRAKFEDADAFSLREIITGGLKGMGAYYDHALEMGNKFADNSVFDFFFEAMAKMADPNISIEELIGLALETGKTNLRVMSLLHEAHTSTFGVPSPSKVLQSAKKGPCILVSGHDLPDLKALLEATEGTGVNVYTHGELLPAHGYPELNKYPHLVGNYGSAWQLQKKEFPKFPGPIIMTTNCLMPPRKTYIDRIYTMHAVGFDNVTHINSHADYKAIIDQAIEMGGFAEDEPERSTITGFGHETLIAHAGDILKAVEDGNLKKLVVIGGCDGSEPERTYFTDLAYALPQESAILTMGCTKYRFNSDEDMKALGEIPGLPFPRVLDCGQCNDSFSAISTAIALAEALNCGVNDLPLSIVLSWFEQKAVAVLLSCLSLDIQNIFVGPTLPAFISPNVLNVLSDKFGLREVSSVDEDIKLMGL